MALCKYWKVCMKKCSQDCEDFEPESYIAEHEDLAWATKSLIL